MSALALDRQVIVKQDFPIGRRGYEPQAVDEHLELLAATVERLERELEDARGATPRAQAAQTLSRTASEQVGAIVAAAEASASEIERSAREEADRLLQEAGTEARRTREAAMVLSEEHVGAVSQATAKMLQRVDAMEGELGALLESLRTGTNRLAADLSLLQGSLGELYEAGGSGEVPSAAAPVPAPRRAPEPAPPAPEPMTAAPEEDKAPAEAEAADGDVEGARLVALNMALNGQTRDETDTYLRDHFDLGNRDALLDEVYATVEG